LIKSTISCFRRFTIAHIAAKDQKAEAKLRGKRNKTSAVYREEIISCLALLLKEREEYRNFLAMLSIHRYRSSIEAVRSSTGSKALVKFFNCAMLETRDASMVIVMFIHSHHAMDGVPLPK
jgi:hypothetical protein